MELTRTPDVAVPPLRFVPAEFDVTDLDALAALVDKLHERPIASADDLRRYLEDWSELSSCIWGERSRRMTAMHRATQDETLRERYLSFMSDVTPAWARHDDRLNRRFLASEHRAGLGEEFAVFDRDRAKAAEIYREENTELSAKARAVASQFDEIMGSITIEFRGETLTREQCGAVMQETDRAKREEAYHALRDRMKLEREKIDAVLDELVALRHKIARNADFENYIGFRFVEMGRYDYTPADCSAFADAVEKVVVPAIAELREIRRKKLGLATLRPWDLEVSLFGTAPQELFKDQPGFVKLLDEIFRAVDPVFASDFDVLVRNDLLDVMSRPGKSPGGYNCPISDIRLPFIFWNAVGRRGDVRVMLHEGGHAFHTLAARDLPLIDYRSAPTEFAEVASMSMELFGFERLASVLNDDELREFTHDQFSGILRGLSYVALVDSFQAWMYRHPEHSRADRRRVWAELHGRFQPGLDWTGLEDALADSWQRIPHLFSHPLYFIEYGIAQIGALQLWRNERADHASAIDGYRNALALGGSRPLPELFEAAGARFAMDAPILQELIPEVMTQLR